MCGAPRKGPSTWCSKLGRENPASDVSGCSCRGHPLVPITAPADRTQGMDIKSPFFKLAGIACPTASSRPRSTHAILGCAVAGMAISMVPRMVLKTSPTQQSDNRFDGDHDVPG